MDKILSKDTIKNVFAALGAKTSDSNYGVALLDKTSGEPKGFMGISDLASVLGASVIIPYSADLNNYKTPGTYTFQGNQVSNAPQGTYSCVMKVYRMNEILWQEVYTNSIGMKYIRSYAINSATWSNWYRNDNYGTTSLSELASALGATNNTTHTINAGETYQLPFNFETGSVLLNSQTGDRVIFLQKGWTRLFTIGEGDVFTLTSGQTDTLYISCTQSAVSIKNNFSTSQVIRATLLHKLA